MKKRLKLLHSSKLDFEEEKIDEKTGKPVNIWQHVLEGQNNNEAYVIYTTFPLDPKRLNEWMDYDLLPKVKSGQLIGWRFGGFSCL